MYYANGKLLLTAEYFVLDGARALALPCKLGQSLTHRLDLARNNWLWQSYDADKKRWFEALVNLNDFSLQSASDKIIGERLVQVLQAAQKLRTEPFSHVGAQIKTHLTFPRLWGLGTSSTLIYNVAQLFYVDHFELLAATFGGSGYDVACAAAKQPILFWREENQAFSRAISFKPVFREQLFFVYLGKKQDSREGIARYKNLVKNDGLQIEFFDQLTEHIQTATDLKTFEQGLNEHEMRVSKLLDLPRAKILFFSDYWGEIKSLGAWGGDFVLATSDRDAATTLAYFQQKGFSTVLKYQDLIL